jgi:hypothetical protein
MTRLLPLALLSLMLLPARATADGCPPEQCGVGALAYPGSSTILLRPMGAVAGYDVKTGRRRFATTSPSLVAADGRSYVTATNPTRRTRIARHDAVTGRLELVRTLPTVLELTAVSADGRRVALAEPVTSSHRNMTRLVVASLATGALRKATLRGRFQAEAVSNDGRRLFLIEYLRSGYRVRLYDVARGRLVPGELRPRNEDEAMTGFPAYAIGSRDGHWLLTLYVKPREREAFVHALDLRRAVAYCVDLPGHAVFGKLETYALALGLDGRTLHAANSALGLATDIDLATLEVAPAVHFGTSRIVDNFVNSAVSPRGDLVYFGGLHGLWAYDLRSRHVRGPYRLGLVGGFGFTPDGRRLTVVSPWGRPYWLDAATGRKL